MIPFFRRGFGWLSSLWIMQGWAHARYLNRWAAAKGVSSLVFHRIDKAPSKVLIGVKGQNKEKPLKTQFCHQHTHNPPFCFFLLQVVCDQMQRLHGENRPHRVCDARPGVRLPPQLLLLLRVRPPAEEGRRVCPEGGPAALQDWLRAGEGLTQLGQPRWLRLRWALCTLSHRSEIHAVVLSSHGTEVLYSVRAVPWQW